MKCQKKILQFQPNIFVFNRQTGNVDVFGTNELSDVWEYRKSLRNEKFSGYLLHVFDVTSSAPSMVLRVVVPVNDETEL
ncbi:hypothetical protein B9Z55_026213 [Caenorhabditis nigoni]|uniref:Uncharacterized protein n=1 Tax=Caenorhabditis nigoni TaxID=1611254 RepID=A0A2G5T2G9_9PELO|nr:hypothetical protein B9Z55_026213 [Caenorhabditis nigoni]